MPCRALKDLQVWSKEEIEDEEGAFSNLNELKSNKNVWDKYGDLIIPAGSEFYYTGSGSGYFADVLVILKDKTEINIPMSYDSLEDWCEEGSDFKVLSCKPR